MIRVLLGGFWLAHLGAGCTPEQGLEGRGFAEASAGTCILSVSDTELNFALAQVNGAPSDRVLALENLGDADCLLTEAALSGSARAFSVHEAPEGPVLPGDASALTLRFEPTESGVSQGTLRLRSNDLHFPERVLLLLGVGEAPALEVTLQEEASPIALGCVGERQLTLENLGPRSLEITRVELGGDAAFGWTDDSRALLEGLPWVVEPWESRMLTLTSTPNVEGWGDEGWLEVASNDPVQQQVRVPVQVTGQAEAWHEQRFEVPLVPKADLIFVFDWSGPLTANRGIIGEILALREALEAGQVDYQVSAIGADDGCHLGGEGPLTPALSAQEFEARFVSQACGEYWSCPEQGANSERALSLLVAALRATNTAGGGCNAGMVRADATLHVIAISDEPEQSQFRASKVRGYMETLPEDPYGVVFHGIGGDWPLGCRGYKPYENYYPLVLESGGLYRSICDSDYHGHMDTLGDAAVPEPGPYILEAVPVPGTLSVIVDGQALDSGWTVDPVDNTLVFEEWVAPGRGSELEVRYASAPETCLR